MRHSGTWQTIWDDRILEIIREEGHGSPSELIDKEEIRVSRQHVSRRLNTLAEHGLLTGLANGVYVLTDEGEAYLDGEYDAEAEAYLNHDAGRGPTATDSQETEG
jgi:DeoR/GlpR family transcriptional regulator of sugar metabolism